MKLSKDEIALLRSLVEWRRANGWKLERDDFTYISPDRRTEFWPGWGKELGDRMFIAYPQPESGKPRERVIPPCLSVREAVDVLVVFGLLPVEFSSAWAAGRESAYTTDEWRVVAGPEEFPVVFQDEIRSEEHLEIVLRDARNRWRGEAIRVQRRRVGVTGWEKVADGDS